MKTFKFKKLLRAEITFDKDIAKRLCKFDYYRAQDKNMKMYEYLENEKRRLSTPKTSLISELIIKWKTMGDTFKSPVGKTLLGIYNKNKKAAQEGKIAMNTNIIDIISKPEALLLAYRAIKGNKGALTKASILPKHKIDQMTEDQKTLYAQSITFPNKFSLHDVYLAAEFIKKGLYPCGSSSRVYVPKPGAKGKQRPITIPPFMDKVVQKAICLILEAIYEPYFEKLNRSFGFRPNKGVHDAITAFKTYYTQGMRNAIEGDVEKAFDSVIKKILLKIMSKRIQDRKFLKLMEDRLNYEYVEIVDGKEIRHTPEIGIPQGGIDSPYLFNIYMNELDEYIE